MKEYKRLPGRRRGAFWARVSLWLGSDHVLSVRNRGYSEEYRRFYFRDIQAIVFRATSSGYATSIVLGIFVLILVSLFLWGLAQDWEAGWLWVVGIAGLLFLAPFVVNVLSGRTCACQIRTAVQTEPLESLNRIRTATKAIRMIQERVEAAQGSISREELFRLSSSKPE